MNCCKTNHSEIAWRGVGVFVVQVGETVAYGKSRASICSSCICSSSRLDGENSSMPPKVLMFSVNAFLTRYGLNLSWLVHF